jgi:hypothetical protein
MKEVQELAVAPDFADAELPPRVARLDDDDFALPRGRGGYGLGLLGQ